MTHWKQSVPIASLAEQYRRGRTSPRAISPPPPACPSQTWVFPQDRDNGIVTFEDPSRQAIEFFTSHIGPFPYEKLADVQVAGMGGGMEHASAIFYGERSVTNRPAFGLVAHEIAHQWFGDSVTEKDWDDAWLSEGFATYFASLATEFYDGRDAFLAAMRRSRTNIFALEKRTPGIAVIHDNLPEIQNGRAPCRIVYQKGGWTLHMLRGVIGTDKFWAGIREYYRRFRDSNASTEDLRRVMEETAGSRPRLVLPAVASTAPAPRSSPAGGNTIPTPRNIELDLAQTQPGDAYRLPLEVAVTVRWRAAGNPAHRVHRQVPEIRDPCRPGTLHPSNWTPTSGS